MFAAILVNCIAIFLAWIAKYPRLHYLLSLSFCLYAAFLGLRYMWGNDMQDYYNMYQSINIVNNNIFNLDSIDYRDGQEYGWVILNILCKPIGFLGMQILISLFQNYVVYQFVKRNVSPEWYWLSVFIYGFGVNFMVLSASMMRQSLAMFVFLLASNYIAKKKILQSLILIILSISVHQSALILLPFCLLGFVKFDFISRRFYYIVLLLFVWILFADKMSSYIFDFLISSESFNKYEIYVNADFKSEVSGFGIFFLYFMTLMSLFHLPFFSKIEDKTIVLISSVSILFIPMLSFGMLICRLGYYFSLFTIAGYPIVMKYWKLKLWFKYCLLSLLCFYHLYLFFAFFYSDTWYKDYYEYHTVLETINWI